MQCALFPICKLSQGFETLQNPNCIIYINCLPWVKTSDTFVSNNSKYNRPMLIQDIYRANSHFFKYQWEGEHKLILNIYHVTFYEEFKSHKKTLQLEFLTKVLPNYHHLRKSTKGGTTRWRRPLDFFPPSKLFTLCEFVIH